MVVKFKWSFALLVLILVDLPVYAYENECDTVNRIVFQEHLDQFVTIPSNVKAIGTLEVHGNKARYIPEIIQNHILLESLVIVNGKLRDLWKDKGMFNEEIYVETIRLTNCSLKINRRMLRRMIFHEGRLTCNTLIIETKRKPNARLIGKLSSILKTDKILVIVQNDKFEYDYSAF